MRICHKYCEGLVESRLAPQFLKKEEYISGLYARCTLCEVYMPINRRNMGNTPLENKLKEKLSELPAQLREIYMRDRDASGRLICFCCSTVLRRHSRKRSKKKQSENLSVPLE